MKKFITLLVFVLFVSVYAYSQTTTGKYEYALVQDAGGKLIFINYGNNKSEEFKEVVKNSSKDKAYRLVDAFNYMEEQGYELIISVPRDDNSPWSKHIFRREIKK